jgi:hypothetical protein
MVLERRWAWSECDAVFGWKAVYEELGRAVTGKEVADWHTTPNGRATFGHFALKIRGLADR